MYSFLILSKACRIISTIFTMVVQQEDIEMLLVKDRPIKIVG